MRKNVFVLLFLLVSFVVSFVFTEGKSFAQRKDKVYGTNLENDPRKGTVHIWTDPETGDRMTVVRPGKKDADTSTYAPQNMPIIVYPQVTPQGPGRPPYPGRPEYPNRPYPSPNPGHSGATGYPVPPIHPGIPVGPISPSNGQPNAVPPTFGPLPHAPVTPNNPGHLVNPIQSLPPAKSNFGGHLTQPLFSNMSEGA